MAQVLNSHRKLIPLTILMVLLLLSCNSTKEVVRVDVSKYADPAEILAIMTLEEKLGQMTQVDQRYLDDINDIAQYKLGSLLSGGGSVPAVNTPENWVDMITAYQQVSAETRLGIPLMYGIDAVHGHNNVVGATVIPHNIGLGATRNPELVRDLAAMTAREVRGTGINWTFAPCVAVARDERWGRTYESFSEDPVLSARLGRAQVEGFQGSRLSNGESIAACTKHFVGDGGAQWGTGLDGMIDRGDCQVDETTLRAIHLPGYIAAIDAGTATIMASYSSWNGVKCHGNAYLLTTLLKEELGFQGFVVSDWRGHEEIPGDYKSDIVTACIAGIDMFMVPGDSSNGGHSYHTFFRTFKAAVEEGLIPMERIDDAVLRILKVKMDMGLMSGIPAIDPQLSAGIGSAEHRQLARQAVRESLVLLKNEDGTLPLSKTLGRIAVVGQAADDIGMQCGGWTIEWQGRTGDITPGTTIYEAIQATVTGGTEVTFSANGANIQGADIAVVVVGETPYAEMLGDKADLKLSETDQALIQQVATTGVPTVVILLSGRPMIINTELAASDAFIAAWLPGTEGQGIADVLFGDYAPTGKLPFTWPATMDQLPINVGDDDYKPLFAYGFGLSY